MAQELAYAIITPYTIRKSRTGAVLSRLFGCISSQLVASQMIALDREMSERYADSVMPGAGPADEKLRAAIRYYIRKSMAPSPTGRRHRALMLVFYGENAQDEISSVVGSLTISADSGETIRNTYGDLVYDETGNIRFFEPAVLVSDRVSNNKEEIRMWLDFLQEQPPLLENICEYPNPEKVEQTLVLLKPDSWRQRSARPGTIIDMFSRTGLRMIGCKLLHMSVAQALEFYGPVKSALHRKLAPSIGVTARQILEDRLRIRLSKGVEESLAEDVGIPYADDQFEKIVEFMSSRRPSACPAELRAVPGTARTLGVVYEGEVAVDKIRDVLGPTDPTKAPDGTVRREFGSDIMVNTAHASDCPENAQREMAILRMRKTDFIEKVNRTLEECD
ncbi:MAG: nucleoside-diphosphate kinase [Lentisphaeria bacterium]